MEEYTFEIGQIFENTYPPEAALWCNENQAYIEEIDSTTREEERQELVRDEVFVDAERNKKGEEITPAYIIPAEFRTYMETVIVRRFQIVGIPEPTAEEVAEQELAQAKADRAAAVAAITVEVDGLVFNGDEAAQQRMARAVTMADSPDEQTEWVLADNTVAVVTADQLRRACKAAGKAQTALWTVPYQN